MRKRADPDEWIDGHAVSYGGQWDDPLLPEIRLQLIVAAATCASDDDVLWCLGDIAAAALVGDSTEMGVRLHEERARNERVDRMFVVMQADYAEMGLGAGWWADSWPETKRT